MTTSMIGRPADPALVGLPLYHCKCRRQGERLCPLRAGCGGRWLLPSCTGWTTTSWRLAGPGGGDGSRTSRARGRRARLHGPSVRTHGMARVLTVSRLHGYTRHEGRFRGPGPAGCRRKRCSKGADRRSCAGRSGSAPATSLRLEAGLPLYGHDPRRDDDAGRGRPSLCRCQAASPGWRLSWRSAHSPRACRRRRPQACRPHPRRQAHRPAPTPSSGTCPAGGSVSSPRAGSARPSAGRLPWAISRRLSRRPAPRLAIEIAR